MKANEQDKIYCRLIRPDGYGEGVVPEMDEPRFDYDFPPDGPTDAMLASAQEDFEGRHDIWFDKLASLPVLYLIHPDLAKVGWVGECRERYEVNNYGEWDEVSKYGYDNQDGTVGRRIVLVPVEGKEPTSTRVYNGWNDNKSRVAGIGGQPGQPADKPEEKEVVSDPFIQKHLKMINFIYLHIGKMWGGPEMASIQHFVESGKIIGSFRNNLLALIDDVMKWQTNLHLYEIFKQKHNL